MIKQCRLCGGDYKIKPSHAAKSSYCSRECMKKDYSNRLSGESNPHYRNAGQHVCQVCGKLFQSYNKTRKYCSDVCKGKSSRNVAHLQRIAKNPKPTLRKTEKTRNCSCKLCNVRFPTTKKRAYCSERCKVLGRTTHMRGRTDKNQAAIVQVLRDVGASVLVTSSIGVPGFPDLVVGFRGVTYLLEVKNLENRYGRKGFNKNQQAWNRHWSGALPVIVATVDEALAAIGAVKP